MANTERSIASVAMLLSVLAKRFSTAKNRLATFAMLLSENKMLLSRDEIGLAETENGVLRRKKPFSGFTNGKCGNDQPDVVSNVHCIIRNWCGS